MARPFRLKARFPVGWKRYNTQAETDPYGDPIPGYDDPVTVYIYGPAPTAPEELPVATTDRLRERLTLYVSPDFPDVDRRDQIVVRGKTYEVDGAVQDYNDGPHGFLPGGTLYLVRVEGGL